MEVLTRRLWGGVMLLLLAVFVARPCIAGELELQEQEIKAGLLYNFLKYTDWPALPPSMTVCIFGEDPFNGYLQPMAGRSVNQHQISLRTIRSADEAGACQLLYVNSAEKDRWPELQKSLSGKPVLTVSDFDTFAESGGMVEFGRKNDHISVGLNVDAVNAAHLRVEDRMLKLVSVVHPSQGEGQ